MKIVFNKRAYFLIIIVIFFSVLFTSCTVNQWTSKISFINKSDIYISNVKIGNLLLVCTLAPGASYDYYFIVDIKGRLTANNAISVGYTNSNDNNKEAVVPRNGNYNLIAGNYLFECEMFKKNGDYCMTIRCERLGYNYGSDDYDDYADGGYYED